MLGSLGEGIDDFVFNLRTNVKFSVVVRGRSIRAGKGSKESKGWLAFVGSRCKLISVGTSCTHFCTRTKIQNTFRCRQSFIRAP